MALTEPVRQQLSDLLAAHRVVLFMKGTRQSPQCGLSAQVVQILDECLLNYETIDVLRSPQLRNGIKQFSEWPTIPQVYIDGKFIGGCDIVHEMNASGELHRLLGVKREAPITPAISMSNSAIKALEAALADAGSGSLHLRIDAQCEAEIFIGPRRADDIEIPIHGLTFLMDRLSAGRAEGIHIDFTDGPPAGFEITHPNAPPAVKPLSAAALKLMLDGAQIVLFDVRPEDERAIAQIAGAHSLDAAGQHYLASLDRATPIAFHCHHGSRSQAAAQELVRAGFQNVYNLEGGIDAWSQSVDSSVPRY